jgi:hypothetical protein
MGVDRRQLRRGYACVAGKDDDLVDSTREVKMHPP